MRNVKAVRKREKDSKKLESVSQASSSDPAQSVKQYMENESPEDIETLKQLQQLGLPLLLVATRNCALIPARYRDEALYVFLGYFHIAGITVCLNRRYAPR